MKKLNDKGFTLIELLAIIVILAIIMVVTIPSILDVVSGTTQTQFKNSANAIEKWVSDTYVLAAIGQGDASGATSTFLSVCSRPDLCATSTTKTAADDAKGFVKATAADTAMYNFLQAAGQKPSNYKSVTISVNSATNRVCVTISPSTGGDFSEATADTTSNGCTD